MSGIKKNVITAAVAALMIWGVDCFAPVMTKAMPKPVTHRVPTSGSSASLFHSEPRVLGQSGLSVPGGTIPYVDPNVATVVPGQQLSVSGVSQGRKWTDTVVPDWQMRPVGEARYSYYESLRRSPQEVLPFWLSGKQVEIDVKTPVDLKKTRGPSLLDESGTEPPPVLKEALRSSQRGGTTPNTITSDDLRGTGSVVNLSEPTIMKPSISGPKIDAGTAKALSVGGLSIVGLATAGLAVPQIIALLQDEGVNVDVEVVQEVLAEAAAGEAGEPAMVGAPSEEEPVEWTDDAVDFSAAW